MKSAKTNHTSDPGFQRLFPYFSYLKPYWLSFTGALLFGALYGATSGFGLPYMIDQIFPKIFPTKVDSPALSSLQIFAYVAWFPVVFLVRGVSGYLNSYLINFCGMKVLERIRLDVFKKLQSLPLSFFQTNKSGDLLSRVMGDTGQLQTAVLSVSNDLIKQPITFIGAIGALCVMAIQRDGMAFVLLCLFVIPICIIPIRRVGELLMSKALNMQQQAGGLSAILSENLSGPTEIRAFHLEKRETDRFTQASGRFLTARMKVIKYSHLLTPLIEIITATGISIAIFQAAKTSIHLDAVVPVIVALYMSYEPVKKLGNIHNTVKEGLASLSRLDHILGADEMIHAPTAPVVLQEVKGRISFQNVSYTYPSTDNNHTPDSPALTDISFTAEPGEVIALVGPSGAGKSTLAAMVPRFLIRAQEIFFWMTQISKTCPLKICGKRWLWFPQKPFLFNTTVRENIELGKSSYTDCSFQEALKHANADGFVEAMQRKSLNYWGKEEAVYQEANSRD